MSQSPALPRKLMLLTAAVQGIALLFLYDAMDSGTWPSESPLWNYPLWVLAVTVPALLLLTLEEGREIRAAKLIGGFALLLVPIAIYVGWQATPYDAFPVTNLTVAFIGSIGLACFKALMYLQQRSADQAMSYHVLFTYSWRNALTIVLSLLLVFVFWLILLLWGQLFRAIEIDFFHDLFEQDWFLFPVLSIAHGVGVIIFRNLTKVIDSVTRVFQGLIKIILPLAAMVSVVFLSALPFVGLEVLWATGRGTSLLLWLLAIILFFTNAVYQDGRGDRPYPLLIHRLLYAALLTTPIISALSFYGLYLRLDEYGWTVMRGWAFVVWLILTLFSVGYFLGIVRKRDDWTLDLAKVNTGMGLVVLALMLVINSPILDLRKLSLKSQVNRLESGQVVLKDFDFWYARNSLGRPGYLFMEAKKTEIGSDDKEMLARIENPSRAADRGQIMFVDEFMSRMVLRPADVEIPDDLRQRIRQEHQNVSNTVEPLLVSVNLDDDNVEEFMLLYLYENYVSSGRLYFRDGDSWRSWQLEARATGPRSTNLRDNILNGEMERVPFRFDQLQFDGVLLRPAEY